MKQSLRRFSRVLRYPIHSIHCQRPAILEATWFPLLIKPPIRHHHQVAIDSALGKPPSMQAIPQGVHQNSHPNTLQSRISPESLVCDRCWNDLFNTEAFERCCTGQKDFDYPRIETTTTVAEINAASCNWCAYIREFVTAEWMPDDRVTISMSPSDIFKWVTPTGRNIFYFNIDCKSPTGKWRGGYSLFLHACTPADDSASKYVTARPMRTDVDSDSAWTQIRSWFQECKEHSSCNSLPRDSPLPTRVIEVSPPGQDRPRVFESNGARGVYATLSYARGKKAFPTLTTSNYAKFTDGLDMNDLPPTIRDAVLTARILSIPYLWIDAFCVLQDVEDDKLKEISRMNNIYGRSALTIVAASTESVYDGLFHPRIHNERLHTVPVRFGPGKFGSMSVNELDAATYDELFEPISKRAWAVQEQVMSNRVLTFTTNTMIWRCNEGSKNFDNSLFFPHYLGCGYNEFDEKYSLNLFSLAISEDEACANKDKALSCWLRLVSSFSLGTTSLENDKLNALAGVASRPSFSHTLGPGYYAGMWQYELARQLAWSTSRSHRTLAEDETFHFYRPENYRAPSWSWASVEGGKVNFDFYYDGEDEEPRKVLCDILECSTLPAHPELNPFGEVSSAQLRLQGPARLAWFNPITSNVFILPESISLASTALDRGDSVITFEEALQKHTDEFVKAHPDEDIAEDPELLNGTSFRNVEGICDETRLREPVLVLAVGITLAKGLDDGVRGLLLVKNDKNYGGGMFQRIGIFERGKTMDFENGQNMKVSII